MAIDSKTGDVKWIAHMVAVGTPTVADGHVFIESQQRLGWDSDPGIIRNEVMRWTNAPESSGNIGAPEGHSRQKVQGSDIRPCIPTADSMTLCPFHVWWRRLTPGLVAFSGRRTPTIKWRLARFFIKEPCLSATRRERSIS